MYEGPDRDERDRDEGGRARDGISPALLAFVVVAVLAVVFVVQNSEEAPIRFLFFRAQTPVWVAIAIAIGVGVLLDRLLVSLWRRRRRSDR